MPRLLIIDDEPDICEILAHALTEAGYAVKTCTNGTEAVDLFRRERADLVFCDLKLPGLDGLAVLEAMKGIDPWATVIMVTGFGSVEVATHALRLGAYDFLEKPFTDAQIQKVASRALEHRRQLRQMATLQGKQGSAADIPARLVQLEQLRADFIDMVIQDLRAPLQQLSELMSMAEGGLEKQDLLNELGRIRASLSRLLLEGFALFLSNDQRVTATVCDVRSIVGGLENELRSACEKRQIKLRVSVSTEQVSGLSDGEKISCIVRELVDNGIQFTPAGGKIDISLEPEPRGMRLVVRDTGAGIPASERDWLFTTLRQPKLERQKRTGIGLALVKHYVDLLQGAISVESQPGKGSMFTVSLPWLNLPAAVAPETGNGKKHS